MPSTHTRCQHKTPPRFVIKVEGDLPSRMRCISSFSLVARSLNRLLHVYWPTDNQEPFIPSSIFKKTPLSAIDQPESASDEPNDDNKDLPFTWTTIHVWDQARSWKHNSVQLDLQIPRLLGESTVSSFKLRRLFQNNDYYLTARCVNELYESHRFVLDLYIPCFVQRHRTLLSKFEPCADVQDAVNDINTQYLFDDKPFILAIYDFHIDPTTRKMFKEKVTDHIENPENTAIIISASDHYSQFECAPNAVVLPVKSDDDRTAFENQWTNLLILMYAGEFYGGYRCSTSSYIVDRCASQTPLSVPERYITRTWVHALCSKDSEEVDPACAVDADTSSDSDDTCTNDNEPKSPQARAHSDVKDEHEHPRYVSPPIVQPAPSAQHDPVPIPSYIYNKDPRHEDSKCYPQRIQFMPPRDPYAISRQSIPSESISDHDRHPGYNNQLSNSEEPPFVKEALKGFWYPTSGS